VADVTQAYVAGVGRGMCGIAGALGADAAGVIERMTEALFHRGPDDGGYYRDNHIAIGQRRLSIIDIEGGQQPIANEDGRLQLVCNGEIYNSPQLRRDLEARGHRFRTRTDVEVILHLYEDHGPDCVEHLQGMFAFAIWDRDDQTLMLARDHLGQKPLFYWHDGGDRFLFASEVKAILAAGVEGAIDLDGLWHYVALRFLPDEHTFFKGVRKLPAASMLLLRGGRIAVRRYWDLDFTSKIRASEPEILDELDRRLRETVRSHLLSDVRVGAFLSGGIDSSLICAMMAKETTGASVPSFSIGVREEGYSELPWCRMAAEHCGLEAHERVVDANLVDTLPLMIRHLDEPADPFGVGCFLVAQEARREVKVVLTGDGGDEAFAGYDRFAGQKMADVYAALPAWFRRHVMRRLIERVPETFAYKSLAQRLRFINEISFHSGGRRYAESMGFHRFTADLRAKLFTPSAREQVSDPDSVARILTYFDARNADDLVDRMLYTDLMTRMPDHNFVLVDRMTMAHSLESRAPLMDHRLVEFAASVPGHLKLNGYKLKYLLRQLALRYLPRELVFRPKQGFGFPLGAWMRTDVRGFVQNLVRHSRFVQLGLFDADYLQQLVHEHLTGKVEHTLRLWTVINLELLHRLYFEGASVESVGAEIRALR
jgi:asparagine synthase (glutamine-hydrolysing)